MTDNITNMLLAQLLMKPREDGVAKAVSNAPSQRPASAAVPYWMPPPQPAQDFESRWPSDHEFEPRLPDWFFWERLRNPVPGSLPQPPSDVLDFDYRRLNDPFRRRFEEMGPEYPRRPLRRR
jgi:hypothetical protein